MKKIMRRSAAATAVVLMAVALLFAPLAGGHGSVSFAAEKNVPKGQVTIVFTQGMHSQVQPVTTIEDDKTVTYGGFARVKTLIDLTREEDPNTLVLDAGDFSMGSLYQTIFTGQGAELTLMGHMGYDVVTFGEREFDYGMAGLADMLNGVAERGGGEATTRRYYDANTNQFVTEQSPAWEPPMVVGTNIDWNKTLNTEETKNDGTKLRQAFRNYGVQDYAILTRNDVRIAVFGVVGTSAASTGTDSNIKWQDATERAEAIVNEIKRNDEADLIICLAHGGVESESETESVKQLAAAVPDIDIIISGHDQEGTGEAVTEGDTLIVSAAGYTKEVGKMVVKVDGDNVSLTSFDRLNVGQSVTADTVIQNAADGYLQDVNSNYFGAFGYAYDQVLTTNNVAFPAVANLAQETESALGNLVADSYLAGYNQKNEEPADVAVVSASAVSGSIPPGDVTAADAFEVLSYGKGKDGRAGMPLVSFTLTGKELKVLAELDISLGRDYAPSRLYFAGMSYKYNTHRVQYNETFAAVLVDGEGKETKIDNAGTYRVVTDLYTAQTLENASKMAQGVSKIIPRDEAGNPVTNLADEAVRSGDGEYKAWVCLADYLKGKDAKALTAAYEESAARKIDKTGINPIHLLRSPNKFTVLRWVVVLIPVLILVAIGFFLRHRRNIRRGYSRSMFGRASKQTRRGRPQFTPNRRRYRRWRK